MTYPIQPEPSFQAAEIEEAAKHYFSQNFFVQDRRLTVCSSIAAAASHQHEENRLLYGPLASILLDQGFSVEYESDHTQEQLLVASRIGYVDYDAKFCSNT